MFVYKKKVNQALLTWFTSMRGNNIPINGPLLFRKLANLRMHLIATLSRHQTDGLEDGKRGTSKPGPNYLFISSFYLKIHNKESGQHSGKFCQWLISKASQTNNLLNIKCQFFTTTVIFKKNKVGKTKIL